MWPRTLLAPLALVPALSLAPAEPTAPAPEAAAPIYFGVGGGVTKFDDDDQFRHQRLDDTDTGYKLQIGAYFTPRFAMEFGYRNYGKFDFEIGAPGESGDVETWATTDRKSTRLNSSHVKISYAVFCLKKKKKKKDEQCESRYDETCYR